jgi:hypothetical protein
MIISLPLFLLETDIFNFLFRENFDVPLSRCVLLYWKGFIQSLETSFLCQEMLPTVPRCAKILVYISYIS